MFERSLPFRWMHSPRVNGASAEASRGARPLRGREIVLVQNGRGCSIWGPSDHSLDSFRSSFPLYDVHFPRLSRIASRTYPDATILDIGANIGDSVALCRLEGCRGAIVAIEPSDVYFPFLEHNIASLPDLYANTRAVQAYVGNPAHKLSLRHNNGTATTFGTNTGASNGSRVPTVPLDSFKATPISLVKIDTDGYDVEILANSAEYLLGQRPILWVEALIPDSERLQAWAELLQNLRPTYRFVTAFDNFGFPVLSGALDNKQQTILDLMSYYHRHQKYPSASHGKPTIYYLDLALFPEESKPLFDEFGSNLPS